ncbi:hypothetical protein AVEN_13225-1 [Araneus ventricosus]|uniref:DUF4817 domain-containing protein n=1 Tax=Araneus ventricosus TaxID=182803 RepID=A0A4Y2DKL8_ARAVE|nr:hypothetical protein AVEN_13225-1 [Araneus ventricosus]
MSKYSVSKRVSIVKAYYSSNNSPIAAQRKFATEYKLKITGPSVITIKNKIEKFERTEKRIKKHQPPHRPTMAPQTYYRTSLVRVPVCSAAVDAHDSVSVGLTTRPPQETMRKKTDKMAKTAPRLATAARR